MKRVEVFRRDMGDQGTLGIAYVYDENGKLLDYFLSGEDPWLNNQADISCIPNGSYPVNWNPSTGRHPLGVYQIQKTSPRVACEIHSGNYFGNTAKGLRSDVEGCMLLGRSTGLTGGQLTVLNSMTAIADFNALMNKEDFMLNIHGDIQSVSA